MFIRAVFLPIPSRLICPDHGVHFCLEIELNADFHLVGREIVHLVFCHEKPFFKKILRRLFKIFRIQCVDATKFTVLKC